MRNDLSKSLTRNTSWALSNMCRNKPMAPFAKIEEAIPALVKVFMQHDSSEVNGDILWAFSYISDMSENIAHIVAHTGIVPKLIQFLNNPNLSSAIASLRTLGNILVGTDEDALMVVQSGILIPVNHMLAHSRQLVRKETAWVVSNITAGPAEQVGECLKTGILEKLVHIMKNDEWEVKKEACWAISNLTVHAAPSMIYTMVE